MLATDEQMMANPQASEIDAKVESQAPPHPPADGRFADTEVLRRRKRDTAIETDRRKRLVSDIIHRQGHSREMFSQVWPRVRGIRFSKHKVKRVLKRIVRQQQQLEEQQRAALPQPVQLQIAQPPQQPPVAHPQQPEQQALDPILEEMARHALAPQHGMAGMIARALREHGLHFANDIDDIDVVVVVRDEEAVQIEAAIAASMDTYAAETQCQICISNDAGDAARSFTGKCDHRCCSRCAERHIEAQLASVGPVVRCIGKGCALPFDPAIVNAACDRARLANFHKSQQMGEFIVSARGGNDTIAYEPCPECSTWSPFVSSDDSAESTIRCMNMTCATMWCRRCKQRAHPHKQCADVVLAKALQADVEFVSKTTKACPSCHIPIHHFRNHGCHHMKCACNADFCFCCLAKWQDNHSMCRCTIWCNERCGCGVCPYCKSGLPCRECAGCEACRL